MQIHDLVYFGRVSLISVPLFPSSGNPKGAMLTHENVVSDAAGVIKSFEVRIVMTVPLSLDPSVILNA